MGYYFMKKDFNLVIGHWQTNCTVTQQWFIISYLINVMVLPSFCVLVSLHHWWILWLIN